MAERRRIAPLPALAAGILCATALNLNLSNVDASQLTQAALVQLHGQETLQEPPLPLQVLVLLRLGLEQGSWAMAPAAALLGWFFARVWGAAPRRLIPVLLILSAVFAVLQVTGLSIYSTDSWILLTATPAHKVLALACMLGYAVLFYSLALALFEVLDSGALCREHEPGRLRRFAALWDEHTWLLACAALALGWLPWLAGCFPGSVGVDSASQVAQFFGAEPLTAHHPVLSTWLHGICFAAAHALGADSLGPFFYVLIQTVLCAMVYAGIVAFANRLGCARRVQWGITAFFALTPVWGAYAQAVIKDTLFAGVFALFLLLVADVVLHPGRYERHPGRLAFLFPAALFTCLLRNNAGYAVLPALAVFCVWALRSRLRLPALCVTLAATASFAGFNMLTGTVLDIPAGSKAEALSVPFQQTARYVKYYGEEVTEEERAAIDAVLDYDQLAARYKPYISDSVKGTYKSPGDADLTRYFNTWLSMGLKHPGCYLRSFQAGSYGYYTIVDTGLENAKEQYFAYQDSARLAAAGLNVQYASSSGSARYTLYNWALAFDHLPLLGLLTNRGFNTWLLVVLFAYCALRRKPRVLLLAVPLGIFWMTCVASPVDDLLRYYLPILACVPLMFAIAAACGAEQTEKTTCNPA